MTCDSFDEKWNGYEPAFAVHYPEDVEKDLQHEILFLCGKRDSGKVKNTCKRESSWTNSYQPTK